MIDKMIHVVAVKTVCMNKPLMVKLTPTVTDISITAKSGAEGKLFGSIGNTDIADAIVAAGVEVAKREVRLPEGPIRLAGEYEITLHLHADVDATVKVTVIGEED